MIKRIIAIAVLVLSGLVQAAVAAPARVVVMRHAEKPDSGNQLNEQGFKRAEALVGFFKTSPDMAKYGAPAAIYAMAPKGEDGTLRPIQTVTPLAGSLGLSIITAYNKKHVEEMAAEIMANPAYEGHTVVISWAHDGIPDVVRALGWVDAPDKWPGKVFDRVWILDFRDGKAVSFMDLPEHLLPGDSDR